MVFNSSYWEYLLFVILRKNLKKWKKHSVLIIFPCHGLNQNSSTSDLSFSQVTSVEKRKSRKHFSASAYGLGLKKLFLSFLFSTSVTWEKLKSDVEKFYFRRDMEKNQNKILFLPQWTEAMCLLSRGVVRTGSTGSMEPVDFWKSLKKTCKYRKLLTPSTNSGTRGLKS